MSTVKLHSYALLIGINDYSAYDDSAGLPAKTTDLRGAVHDVRQYWRMARALGIPARNIRVVCAPSGGKPLNATALPWESGAHVTGASLADIEAGLDWLASKLDTSGVSGGIVSVSTHGSYDAARGSLICASDTRLDGKTLTGTLPMADLFARLDGRAPHTPVTVFLDACDAGGGPKGQGDRARALQGGPSAERAPVEVRRRPGDLLLAASAPGTESYEITVDDTTRGAFSWAALAVLERWGIHQTATDTHFDITYGDLQRRVDALLKAMNVAQTAHFDAPPAQAKRKVFTELRGIELGAPDRPFFTGGREISPGTNGQILEYKVMKGIGTTQKATLCVPGKDCGEGWEFGRMYWFRAKQGYRSAWEALGWGDITIEAGISHEPSGYGFSPDAADMSYLTGDVWTKIAFDPSNLNATFGSFNFGGIPGYIIAKTNGGLMWLLGSQPGKTYLVDNVKSNPTGLFVKRELGAPSAGTYYESDDS